MDGCGLGFTDPDCQNTYNNSFLKGSYKYARVHNVTKIEQMGKHLAI